VTPQTTTIKAAAMNAAGWPVARAVHFAKREKGDEELITVSSAFGASDLLLITGRQRRDLETFLSAASRCHKPVE